MAWATAAKSTMAVWGECSPPTPVTWGSTSASSAAWSQRRPGTPLVSARSCRRRSGPTSAALVATTTLPHSS